MIYLQVKRIEEPGYIMVGADYKEIKESLPFFDVEKARNDREYLELIKDSMLMEHEAWGDFRYIYLESVVEEFENGYIWIKAKLLERT